MDRTDPCRTGAKCESRIRIYADWGMSNLGTEHRCTAGPLRAPSGGNPSTGQNAGLVSTLLPAHRLSTVLCLTAQPSFPQHDDRGLNVSPRDIPSPSFPRHDNRGLNVSPRDIPQPSIPQYDDRGLNISPRDIPQLSTCFLHGEGIDVMLTTPISIFGWNTFQINVGKKEE